MKQDYEVVLVQLAQEYPKPTVLELGWLKPEDIRDELVRDFWARVVGKVGKSTEPYDARQIVSDALNDSGVADHTSRYRLYETMDAKLTPETVGKEIAKNAYLRRKKEMTNRLATAVHAGEVEEVQRLSQEIAENKIAVGNKMRTAKDVSEMFNIRVEQGNISIPWGIAGMDKATGGKERGTLTVVAARPSMGKSSLIIQAARNDSVKYKAGLFSPEMSDIGIWARIACPRVGLAWRDVISGQLTTDELEKLKEESSKIAGSYEGLYIDDIAGITTSEIYQKTMAMGLDVVYIDHLGELGDTYGDNENLRRGNIVSALKNMAKSMDIPVILAAQLSRAVERRSDKRPVLADLRESGFIEQIADNILMMYRPAYYDDEEDDYTEMWFRKHRQGVRGEYIELNFDKVKQWFTSVNWDDDEYVEPYWDD